MWWMSKWPLPYFRVTIASEQFWVTILSWSSWNFAWSFITLTRSWVSRFLAFILRGRLHVLIDWFVDWQKGWRGCLILIWWPSEYMGGMIELLVDWVDGWVEWLICWLTEWLDGMIDWLIAWLQRRTLTRRQCSRWLGSWRCAEAFQWCWRGTCLHFFNGAGFCLHSDTYARVSVTRTFLT